jgi:hypothetical protein
MSDSSQGDGWWIASDGKWYAPELHPTAVATSEAEAAIAAALAGPATAQPTTAQPAATQTPAAAQQAPAQGPPAQSQYQYQQPTWGQPAAGPAQQSAAPRSWGIPAGGTGTGGEFTFGGNAGRRKGLHGRALVAAVAFAVVVLGGVGVGVYFVTRPSTTSPGGAVVGANGSHTAAMGQSVTERVNGTTVTMTISKILNPAPGAQGVGPQANQSFSGTPVAFLVTFANSGSTAFALRNLVFGVAQANTFNGSLGYTTTAGPTFRQSGTLAAGATDSGWVTTIAAAGAGPVTSINVTFNSATATSGFTTVYCDWTVA